MAALDGLSVRGSEGMEAYIYRAALLCEDCAHDIDADLCGDSEHCPQGPYPDGGGESDSPAHCDRCRVFLENPLTDDGREYVSEAIEAFDLDASGDADTINEWRVFYADTLD